MKPPARAALVAMLLWTASAGRPVASSPLRIDFDTFPVDRPPPGFSTHVTGPGVPGVWVIRKGGGGVLVQTSTDETANRFPLCVYDRLLTHDVVVSTRFKSLSGAVDQAAGLVVRFRDKDNYYIVRANALEGNVRLYKVVDGKREQFAGADVKVAPGVWHTLRVSLARHDFEVWFNGERLFDAHDMTHEEAGEVGLWTKADSVTAFDDFTIEQSDADR